MPARTEWVRPVKKEAIQFNTEGHDAELHFENLLENGRIDAVERSAEVKEKESCDEAGVKGCNNVVVDF